MARDDERGELEHTGYRSGRVRIVGAEPAGRSAAMRSGQDDPSWSDGEHEEEQEEAPADTVVTPPLPHWTEPATGEVPAILARESDRGDDPFAGLRAPTWREEGSDWETQDEEFEPSMLAGDQRGQGSLDAGPSDRQPWVFDLPGTGASSELFDNEDAWPDEDEAGWDDFSPPDAPAGGLGAGGEAPITEVLPVVGGDEEPELPDDVPAGVGVTSAAFELDEPEAALPPEDRAVIGDLDGEMEEPKSRFRSLRPSERRAAAAASRAPRTPSRRPGPADRPGPPPGPRPEEAPPRNVGTAVVSGLVLGGIALIAFKMGPVVTVALATVVVTMAAAEAFAAFRHGGYHPVTLLGLVATVSLMIASYNKGEAALPLVLVLLVAFCFIWHLAGVERTDTVRSIGTTLFVFGWVAVFGSFAALLLAPSLFPERHGIAFLLGGLIAAVAYDVGALTFGAWLGRHPMSSVSPNKTWEGFVGGLLTSVIISVVAVHLVHPWTVGKAAALGLVVSVVATVGDLFESTVKRHLGLKDMGRLLPGHGGLLDRVDGLLFAMPATFYLVIAFHLR